MIFLNYIKLEKKKKTKQDSVPAAVIILQGKQ